MPEIPGLPQFPQFKKLELSDREEVEKITRDYPPYSDFNFVSMWSWDAQGGMQLSKLNGNLVVRFTDYITNSPFYSLIGESKVAETILQIIQFARERGESAALKLVPEIVAEKLELGSGLEVAEDPDNFDYVYDLEKLSTYDGHRLRSRRNLTIRYRKAYLSDSQIRLLDPGKDSEKREILQLLELWVKSKRSDVNENEFAAIRRALDMEQNGRFVFVGLFIKGNLAGFVINEALEGDYAILHFEKADIAFVGIYSFLMQENAKILLAKGKKHLNYEQDLGVPGLRLAKKAYRPSHYLKKYLVTLTALPAQTIA